jgi:hypothetical protein
MKILLTKEQEAFLMSGNMMQLGDNEYYFIPFWFKKNPDGTWEEHNIEKLPKELEKAIQQLREQDDRKNEEKK